jgi:hypothetical protein
MLSFKFVVLAKKNLGANPVNNKAVIVGFNKHRFISQMHWHRFKSHSKEQSLSESVNQPLQPYTKGSDLYPHVEL